MAAGKRTKPVMLCILDGWGTSHTEKDNAILAADTPFWDSMLASYPHSELETSGLDVGLPEGQMGNSEVGHMNIGSGRVVMQDLPRINQAITDGSLAESPILAKFIQSLKKSGGACHLLGLLSDGGVHAYLPHITALAETLSGAGIPVRIHAFLDGRDTPPSSSLGYVEACEAAIAKLPNVAIATVSGRYYAMDRDKRWERVEKAYSAMVDAKGEKATSARAAVEQSYQQKVTDEFVIPTVIGEYKGMQEGDGLLMANFRADRAREILTTLVDPGFDGFARAKAPVLTAALGMVEYSESLNAFMDTLFAPESLTNILPEVIARAGLTQLRIAETEKYAHVTFFFSGGREEEFPGEKRVLVPSPKVTTYDMQPEMSALKVTEELLAAVESEQFDLIVVNYANGDMVGHTGDMAAAIKAVETLDKCLAQVVPAVVEKGGAVLITADHGNAEQMVDPHTHEPHTAHTTNPVPFVLAGAGDALRGIRLENGRLCDVAPTILALMEIAQPEEMTGRSLLVKPLAMAV